eukprot:EG_transcript_22959
MWRRFCRWRSCRWRFETPQMEAEFQVQMGAFVGKTFNVWCAFLFLFFATVDGLLYLLPQMTFEATLPYMLVLVLLLGLFLLTNLIPAIRRSIPTVLPLVCVVIFALVGWGVHRFVGLSIQSAMESSLVHTVALLHGQPEAQAELLSYVQDQLSRKLWFGAMLIMYVTVDALRLTGTTSSAFYVHVVPLIVIVVTTYCSDHISHKSLEVMSVAVIFAMYTAVSSLHMLGTFRDRFRVDYQLWQRMAKEAQLMEAAKDVEVAQRQASQKADSMLNHILKN